MAYGGPGSGSAYMGGGVGVGVGVGGGGGGMSMPKGMNHVKFVGIPDTFTMTANCASGGIKNGVVLSLKNMRTQRFYKECITYKSLGRCNCYFTLNELLEMLQTYMNSSALMQSRVRIVYTVTSQGMVFVSYTLRVRHITNTLHSL